MFGGLADFLPSVAWTLIAGGVLTAGDLALRSWFEAKWHYGFEVTFTIYVVGVFCMMMSFFRQNIAVATVATIILNAIVYLIIAHLLYGDTISTWKVVGIAFGLIGFAILELS